MLQNLFNFFYTTDLSHTLLPSTRRAEWSVQIPQPDAILIVEKGMLLVHRKEGPIIQLIKHLNMILVGYIQGMNRFSFSSFSFHQNEWMLECSLKQQVVIISPVNNISSRLFLKLHGQNFSGGRLEGSVTGQITQRILHICNGEFTSICIGDILVHCDFHHSPTPHPPCPMHLVTVLLAPSESTFQMVA